MKLIFEIILISCSSFNSDNDEVPFINIFDHEADKSTEECGVDY